MKTSNIKPGVKATTKLNGRDQVVTVVSESLGKGGPTQWIVRTPAGNNVYRTARKLREFVPANSPVDVGASHVSEYNVRQARRPVYHGLELDQRVTAVDAHGPDTESGTVVQLDAAERRALVAFDQGVRVWVDVAALQPEQR
jgi:hypothetical protein